MTTELKLPLNSEDIKTFLPHRYPFLLLDRVTAVDMEEKSLKGYKNLSANEEFFNGHFPGNPIMPGVLILEALAQAAGVLGFISSGNRPSDGYLFLYAGVDKVRFKNSAYPGDRLDLEVKILSEKRGIYRLEAKATVEGKLITSAEILCAERKVS
jgi:3-hydroxyacyl-[acyl-carrier-protein] dehydratase